MTPWLPLTVQVAEQFVVLYDMEGWRLSHSFHLRKVHAHISTLQARSPAAAHADVTPLLGLSARRGRRAGAGLLLPPAAAPEARARAQGCRPLGPRDTGAHHADAKANPSSCATGTLPGAPEGGAAGGQRAATPAATLCVQAATLRSQAVTGLSTHARPGGRARHLLRLVEAHPPHVRPRHRIKGPCDGPTLTLTTDPNPNVSPNPKANPNPNANPNPDANPNPPAPTLTRFTSCGAATRRPPSCSHTSRRACSPPVTAASGGPRTCRCQASRASR